MPKYIDVLPLDQICINTLTSTILQRITKPKKNNPPKIAIPPLFCHTYKHLLAATLPPLLFNAIAANIHRTIALHYNTHPSKPSKMVHLMEMTFHSNVKHIDSTDWPPTMCSFLIKNLTQLPRLQYLTLNFKRLDHKHHQKRLIKAIIALKHLESFTLHYDCTDSMLKTIARNCPNLRHLDIAQSNAITDKIVPHLLECNMLTTLNLAGTSITSHGYAELLLTLKLDDIGPLRHFAELTRTIRNHGKWKQSAFPSIHRIHNNRCDIDWTNNNLDEILSIFPRIEDINLKISDETPDLDVIETLAKFQQLKVLTFTTYCVRIPYDRIESFLRIRGANLTVIILQTVTPMETRILVDLGQCCQRLQFLDLKASNFEDDESDCKVDYKATIRPFQYLESCLLFAYCTTNCLRFVLETALKVKYIKLQLLQVHHDWIVDLLEVNPLLNLEELIIRAPRPDLGVETITYIIDKCPKLRCFKGLYTWKGIQRKEVAILHEIVKNNNFDLAMDAHCGLKRSA